MPKGKGFRAQRSMSWELTDHCCRVCLGRILRRKTDAGWLNRCADCGMEMAGTVDKLCACGTRLHTNKSAGLRCRRNPDGPTAENPAEIVIEFVGTKERPAMAWEPSVKAGKLL